MLPTMPLSVSNRAADKLFRAGENDRAPIPTGPLRAQAGHHGRSGVGHGGQGLGQPGDAGGAPEYDWRPVDAAYGPCLGGISLWERPRMTDWHAKVVGRLADAGRT